MAFCSLVRWLDSVAREKIRRVSGFAGRILVMSPSTMYPIAVVPEYDPHQTGGGHQNPCRGEVSSPSTSSLPTTF